jgi:hypothetical protein
MSSSITSKHIIRSALTRKPDRYILLMLEELNKAMTGMKGSWVKQYWKSNSFGEMITRHERRLQTLRQNLIVSLPKRCTNILGLHAITFFSF